MQKFLITIYYNIGRIIIIIIIFVMKSSIVCLKYFVCLGLCFSSMQMKGQNLCIFMFAGRAGLLNIT